MIKVTTGASMSIDGYIAGPGESGTGHGPGSALLG